MKRLPDMKIPIPNNDLKTPKRLNFKQTIGTTTYIVNAHFNSEVKEDVVAKIKSLITR